jgi:hypothetical protein
MSSTSDRFVSGMLDDSPKSADGFDPLAGPEGTPTRPSYNSPLTPHPSPNSPLYTTDRNQGGVLALENGGWPSFLKNCDEIVAWTKRDHGSHGFHGYECGAVIVR